jgi:autotransporter translocation and assembly factor TamB
MKKLLVILIIVLALLGISLFGAWWWLTTTRSGAAWMLERASGVVPSLDWQSLDGGLRGGLVLRDVQLDEADTSVRVERLELAARVALLPSPSVDVHWLRADGVRVRCRKAKHPIPRRRRSKCPTSAARYRSGSTSCGCATSNCPGRPRQRALADRTSRTGRGLP